MIPYQAIFDAKVHALDEYPREACGVLVGWAGSIYRPVANIAPDPHHDFQMPADAWVKYGIVSAVLHSHIIGVHQCEPSAADVARQAETCVPWGIIHVGPDSAADPLWFGDHVLNDPLLGREFVWNVRDCWQLARSYYWQIRKVRVPNVAVAPRWNHMGLDLFSQHIPEVGFQLIHPSDVTVGDFALLKIRGTVPNHCAVMIEPGVILHHLENRLSCREPASRWAKHIVSWWRYAA